MNQHLSPQQQRQLLQILQQQPLHYPLHQQEGQQVQEQYLNSANLVDFRQDLPPSYEEAIKPDFDVTSNDNPV